MRRSLLVAALIALAVTSQAAAQTVPVALPSQAASPVMRGDWPDPDVTRIDGAYYAVATSGAWAPTFRILRSGDLRRWSIVGSVFLRPPGWAKDSFWAPELARLPGGEYALFYSAYPHRRPGRTWFCLGVATARSPLGPWRDLGRPLLCSPRGAIDPTLVVERGRPYLVYKEDGNAFKRPTPILLQRLRNDGRRLLGRARELIRNSAPWEAEVIEAPALVRRGGWWHMLYSGSLCCSPGCSYAVGAARARQLAGPWRRHPGNPILRSGNGWRCPGHASIAGGRVAFHAYRDGDFLSGRQMHLAPLRFGDGGWPSIGDGVPLPAALGAGTTSFRDGFAGRRLALAWEWPATRPPLVRVARGLTLQAPARAGARPDAGLIARRLGSGRYTATALVQRGELGAGAAAGLAIVRGGPFSLGDKAIGVTADPGAVRVWQRAAGQLTALATLSAPVAPVVYLRIEANGAQVRLGASPDGVAWTWSGVLGNPVGETARIALTAGGVRGATAHFGRAALAER
jgi:xylan 1,4-beta-xylosidase